MYKRHFSRYRFIAAVLVKYRLKEMIRTLGLERFLPMRWVPPGNPWHKQIYTKPQRMRMALEELGTTFVKVGQIISTRTDLLPPDFALELAKLQDSLKPLPVDVMKKVIGDELGRGVEEVFASFDANPVGVASIGQAHAATLHDGTEVVVKARKPGVVEQVEEDLEILHQLAEASAHRWEGAQQYDLVGIVEEIAETLTAEMDYLKEGHSAEHFAGFFHEDPSVHIPKIVWEFTRARVLTLERIRGISVLDVESLDKGGFDRKELAKRCVNLWLKMVFEGEVFHADPHPGNLFVEDGGRLGLIDFGMIGIVDNEVREHLASALKGILERDVDLLVDSLMDLGAVRPEGSRDNLRKDLKHVMGHYPKLSMAEMRVGSNLGELITVLRRNYIQLPSNSFLLLKTMAMAQSLGKGLDSDFDIFPMLEPHVKRVMKGRYSTSAIIRRLPSAAANMAISSMELPQRVSRLLRTVERGELKIRADASGLERHLEHLERIVNRIVIGLILAAIIIGLAVFLLAYRVGR